jgi:hypothetical protein
LLKHTPFYLAVVVCLAALPACTLADEADSKDTPESLAADESERLRALGYVDFAPEPADSSQVGVVQLDSARAQPGHNLVVSSLECAARLIDLAGNELHRWKQQDCHSWWSAELLRNGDLVVNGKEAKEPEGSSRPPASSDESLRAELRRSLGRYTARISWTGDVIWLRYLRSHHQIDWTPANEALVLTESQIPAEEFHAAVSGFAAQNPSASPKLRFHNNSLNWLGADGELKKSVSLFRAVTQPRDAFDFVGLETMLEGSESVGLFHANSAYAMDQAHLAGKGPLFAEGNVLVTSRNQNRIFIIDPRGPSLLWDWGRDDLSGPHDGTWLANGNLLVFDNGLKDESSRVLEIDPHRKAVVWSYPDGRGAEFNCPTRGMAQRLQNGNTLIVNAQDGEAFEVTPEGERVWRYFNPFLPDNENRPTLVSLKRYPESWVLRETAPD